MITTSSQDRILTNQLLLDELELWNLFDSKSIDDDQTQKYYKLIDDLLDSQIGESIAWLQSDAAEEYFFEQVSLQKEIFDALEDSWDDILENSYPSVDELLDNIYEVGKEKGYSNIRESLRYTDADKEAIRIAKDYNFYLIRKLDNDLRETVKNKILKGIISGENPYNLAKTLVDAGVQQLDGSPFTARQRATMIAKTETSRMQNTGMLQSYVNEGYTQVKILTAEDKDVCTTCLEYAFKFNKDEPRVYSPELLKREKVHDIVTLIKGGKFPPFHPLCRCTYLTVWETKKDAPSNPPVINLTPMSANMTRSKITENNLTLFKGKFVTHVETDKVTGAKVTVQTYENGLSLAVSEDSGFTHDEIIAHINSLPEIFQELHLKRINILKEAEGRKGGGTYNEGKKQVNYNTFDAPKSHQLDDITHELSHAIDFKKGGNSNENRMGASHVDVYTPIAIADRYKIERIDSTTGKTKIIYNFPSSYAHTSYFKYKEHYDDMIKNYPNADVQDHRFMEDFAESSRLYLNPSTHDWLVKFYPNRAKYLESIYGKPKWDKNSPLYKALKEEGKL